MENNDVKSLQEKLEEYKELNLNLRFDAVERQLNEIKDILRDYIISSRKEIEALKANDIALEARIVALEEHRKECPIITVKHELKRYGTETSFLRGLFKNPLKGVTIVSIFTAIIVVLVLVFGPKIIFETLLKLKGL